MDRLDFLKQQLAERMTEMRAMHESLPEGQTLTRAQNERWKTLEAEVKTLQDERDNLVTARQRVLDAVSSGSATTSPGDDRGAYGEGAIGTDGRPMSEQRGAPQVMFKRNPWEGALHAPPAELRARAATAIERDLIGDDTQREHTTKIVERSKDLEVARWAVLASDPAYESAWRSVIANASEAHMVHLQWTPDEHRAWRDVQEWRAINIGTPGDGGYLVPTHLDPAVMHTSDLAVNPFRQLASVETITTKQYNGVVSSGISATYSTEFGVAGEQTPAFTPAPVVMHRYQSYVTASFEAVGDVQNLAAEVGTQFADAVFELEAEKFANGSGTNEPEGLITGLAGGSRVVATQTNNAITVADFESAQLNLAPRYRGDASWLMNLAYINRVRALGDETIYSAQTTDGTQRPRQFLDLPLYEASEFTPTLNTSTNNAIVCGSYRRGYKIVDRVGTTIQNVPHVMDPTTNRPIGAQGWYLFGRNGAAVVDDKALTLLAVRAI